MKRVMIFLAVLALCSVAFSANDTKVTEQGMGAIIGTTTAISDQTQITPEYAAWKAAKNGPRRPLDTSSLCNALVCVQTDEDGDFNIGTSATHPFPNASLLFFYPGDPWSSDIRIYVDGFVWNLTGEVGNGCDGFATYVGEVNTGSQIVTTYSIGNLLVEVIHTPVMFSGTAGAILTRTVVTNNDDLCHQIGVLYEYDTTVDGDDAAELYLGPTHLLDETCFDAPYTTTYWDAIPTSGNIVGRGVFTGGDAVTPDHLAFGQWGSFYSTCWNRVCSNAPYGDSAVLYQWDPVQTCPGASRNVATYYGVGELEIAEGDLQISVAQPRLECGRFPNGVQPDPFELLVNVTNTGGTTCHNISVIVSGGAGPGGTAPIIGSNPQFIASLTPGNNAAVSFTADLNGVPEGGCIYYDIVVTSTDCPTNAVDDYCVEVPPCDNYLPVEVLGFTAIPGNNRVTLNWSTSSETNNDHFDIERNGVIVNTVAGHGNSSENHSYTWTDNQAVNGRTYTYTLFAVDVNGVRDNVGSVNAMPNTNVGTIGEYALSQNYPNPFNPTTEISYDMAEAGSVSLKVYNVMGQLVATLVNGQVSQGRHTVSFDAASLPSGVYVYKMETAGFSAQHKMLLMK